MKELLEITRVWKLRQGSPLGLATLVRARGSSYRQLGTRMLIGEDGATIGAISGGCLEEEVAKRARGVLETGQPELLAFDTRRLFGCHGSIEVFVERVGPECTFFPFVEQCVAQREPGVAATIFAAEGPDLTLGTCPVLAGGTVVDRHPWSQTFSAQWEPDSLEALSARRCVEYSARGRHALLQPILPCVRLILVGAGPDVRPLAMAAWALGWETIVVIRPGDDPVHVANLGATVICATTPEDLVLPPDSWTVAVLMSHVFARDCSFLRALLPWPLPYVGLLGSRQRREMLLAALDDCGGLPETSGLAHLYGPAGLDLGGETPEEIALSIVAEIRAVLSGKGGGFLKNHTGPIHARPVETCLHPSR